MKTPLSAEPRSSRHGRNWIQLGSVTSALLLSLSGLQGVAPAAAQTATAPTVQFDDRGLTRNDDQLLVRDGRLDDMFEHGLDNRQADMLGRLLQLSTSSVRLVGIDDVLLQARDLGFDGHALADMLGSADIRQEDRQSEVGDDRLTGQSEPEVQASDVQHEDRNSPQNVSQGVSNDDSRPIGTSSNTGSSGEAGRSSRGADDAAQPYYGSPSTNNAASVTDRSATTPSSTTSTSTSNSANSNSSKTSTSTTSNHNSGGGQATGGHDDGGAHR